MVVCGVQGGEASVECATASQPRLVSAAHEFEAQMMKELIAPLNCDSGLNGTGEGEDSGSNGALGEFASEALGRALSQGGGFGIAAAILKELSSPIRHNGTVPVIGNLPARTIMKTPR